MGLGSVAKAIASFLIIEFVLIFFVLVIMGAFTSPMQFIVDLAASNGTTVEAISIAVFMFGTLANLIFMFVLAIRR